MDAGIAVVDDVQYLPTVGEMASFVDKTPQSLPVFSLRTSVYAAGIDMGKFTYQIVLDVCRSAFCQLLVVGGIAIGRSKSEDMYGTYLLWNGIMAGKQAVQSIEDMYIIHVSAVGQRPVETKMKFHRLGGNIRSSFLLGVAIWNDYKRYHPANNNAFRTFIKNIHKTNGLAAVEKIVTFFR